MNQEILTVAKKIMIQEGLSFKLDDIAKNLKISKKTIYKYVKNKEEIIRLIIQEGFDYTKAEQRKVLASDLPLLNKIKSLMVIAPENPEVFNSENMRNLRVYYPVLYQEVNTMLNSDWQVTFDLMTEAQDQGILKQFDFNLFRELYINGIFFDYENDITYQQRLINIIEMLFEGVTT